jgi:transcriptional regulator with XRE-family HTH domain
MKRNTRAQVRRWMQAKGWGQGDLADAIGLHQSTVSQMLQGRAKVPLAAGIRLSELTGIAALDLVSDVETLKLVESYVERQKAGA